MGRLTILIAAIATCVANIALSQTTQPATFREPTTTASISSPDRPNVSWGRDPYSTRATSGLAESAQKFSGVNCDCRLRVEIAPGPPEQITISLRRADKTICSFKGHHGSTFFVYGDCFYYAEFSPDARGGEIVAVDLKSNKELWRSKLDAIDTSAAGTACSNHITFDIRDESHDNWKTRIGRLAVFRDEGGKRYLELKDFDTGKTIGHHLYEPKPQK